MDTIIATPAPLTAAADGRALVDRALDGGAITLADAARLHRAIGWPPPRLDATGAIRPPTPDELAQWASTDPAITSAMEWPALVEEIDHRAPAVAASMLAVARETALELRARDHQRGPIAAPAADDSADDIADDSDGVNFTAAPVTADELETWARIGAMLASVPPAFRHVVGLLSRLDAPPAGEVIQ